MSGRLLRWVCTGTAVGALLTATPPAHAAPGPDDTGERPVSELLTDLQDLYQKAEEATEKYNATEEKLKEQRTEVTRLNRDLTKARTSVHDSRGDAGRFARQQYQGTGTSQFSPYVRLLLARNPQQALDQGHVIGRVAAERAAAVRRLAGGEKKAAGLAATAQRALATQVALAARQKKARDTVQAQLKEVEELLASLSPEQLAELAKAEESGTAEAQRKFLESGALSGPSAATPSRKGNSALDYAVRQIGKPYEWGAEGPETYDCSGLTSEAWAAAGKEIPRTSQEQWAELPHVPLRELRPGDLIVYFPKATHVAMYLGDGMIVQAPRPGSKVKVSPIASNPVLGAVRPDPGSKAMRDYTPPKLPKGATAGDDTGYSPVSEAR
ncbi:C40 family peptidase [Streptomyces sp. MZ04]|uniref:C40 family peptidase n=1 Tax=Streptomyces sp. MZ04 TaxID=2559236 RepID=UPI00107ED304|nr:C40 family peptidase [Streptomyces sp. MZ04]TGB13635.1 peptidoglycan endopeptidase [Streptomyces sp. MZ04]